MDESTDARRILTAVPQSEWRRPVGRPYTSWMANLKNDLAQHNLTLEDAIELALNKPLWRLLAASGATHWWCMPNNDDDDDLVIKCYRHLGSFWFNTVFGYVCQHDIAATYVLKMSLNPNCPSGYVLEYIFGSYKCFSAQIFLKTLMLCFVLVIKFVVF